MPRRKKTVSLANSLTEARIDAAVRFAGTIEEEARSLEMPNLRVETSFAPCKLCSIGNHSAELLLSANLGEPPRPIAKIASGGELSRIMLAIKSALADKDNIDTLILMRSHTGCQRQGRAEDREEITDDCFPPAGDLCHAFGADSGAC